MEINDEVRRLMDLLEKKTNTYKQDPAKVCIIGYRYLKYVAHEG